MEKDAFIMQLRTMIEIKLKVAELLEKYDFQAGNSLVEAILNGIGSDASKHVAILRGLMDRARGLNQTLPEYVKDEVLNRIDQVIALEWNIMNQSKLILDKIVDEKTKQILTNILGDVQRHERVLKDVKILVEGLTVEEERVLDKIWKYSVKFDDDLEED